jgi:pimeloyl-ACP methyl ester carboxylesterase
MLISNEILNRHDERIDYDFHPSSREGVLVILGHGLTGNKDRPLLVAVANGLAKEGWPCLRISYSGNGYSGGRFEDSCITKGIADLQSVLDQIPAHVKVAYVGHSMGGAVGVLTAARDLRVTSLITLAGMVHSRAFIEREFASVTPGAGCMWDEPAHPLSETFYDDLKYLNSTLDAVAAITQPWLLIHCDGDDIVPIQDSRDAYEAATCERKLVEISGGSHGFDEVNYPETIAAIHASLESCFTQISAASDKS